MRALNFMFTKSLIMYGWVLLNIKAGEDLVTIKIFNKKL